MASDPRWYGDAGGPRTYFNSFASSADASGNGVTVKAAETGKTLYVLGYSICNGTGGTLNYYLAHTTEAAGKTQIAKTEYVAATTTMQVNFDVPLASASAVAVGFVASGAGASTFQVWGYSA